MVPSRSGGEAAGSWSWCPDSGGWKQLPSQKVTKQKGCRPFNFTTFRKDSAERRNVQAEHPEIVSLLTKLLEQFIADGRSTPGSAAPQRRLPGRAPQEGIRSQITGATKPRAKVCSARVSGHPKGRRRLGDRRSPGPVGFAVGDLRSAPWQGREILPQRRPGSRQFQEVIPSLFLRALPLAPSSSDQPCGCRNWPSSERMSPSVRERLRDYLTRTSTS